MVPGQKIIYFIYYFKIILFIYVPKIILIIIQKYAIAYLYIF